MKQDNDLTQGSIPRGLILFALPLLATSIIQQLYNTVDLIFVGKLVGKGASAAVGSTSLITVCVISFFNGLGVGVGVIMSHFFGSKDYKSMHRTVHTAAGITIVGSIVVTILGIAMIPTFLRWMQVPDNIFDMARTYLTIYFISIFSIVTYNMGSGILRAIGNSKSPMYYQLFGGLVNILGDFIFIAVFHMGVAGTALATLFSQSFAALLVLHKLVQMPQEYRFSVRKIRIHLKIAKQIFTIGIPEALRSMLITFANMILQTQINTYGVDSMAAYAAYCKVEGFIYFPQWSFGQANTVFVGQNIGAKKMDRVKQSTRVALTMAVGVTIVICALILIFPSQVFRVFSSDADVVALSVKIAKRTYALYFLYAIVEVLSGVVRGAGKSTPPMVISLINMCGVRLIVLRILMMFFDTVDGIAIVFPITWITTATSVYLYYRSGRWKPKELIN